MTDQDRQYMVDVDDDNLRAFLNWHDDARRRGVLNVSFYAILKMCWMAARNSQRTPEYAPSRDILPPAPPAPREMPARRRSLNPEVDLRVRPGDRVHFIETPPVEPFAHQVRGSGQSAATVPGAQAMNWPQQSPERHREAQRYVETQAMPALRDDPFEKVRLSGPQQAALDRMYPEPGFQTMEFPIVGPIESVSSHRRELMEARYAGLRDYGPPGPVMTPLQALPEPEDGS